MNLLKLCRSSFLVFLLFFLGIKLSKQKDQTDRHEFQNIRKMLKRNWSQSSQKGATSVLFLHISLILSLILVLLAFKYHRADLLLAQEMKHQLCLLELGNNEQEYVFQVERLNAAIKLLNAGKLIPFFLPGINLSSIPLTELKEVIKKTQDTLGPLLWRKRINVTARRCPQLLSRLLPLYHSKRLPNGTLKLKSNNWDYQISSAHYRLQLLLHKGEGKWRPIIETKQTELPFGKIWSGFNSWFSSS